MTPFSIAGIQMWLTTHSNLETMRHRLDLTMHLYPWVQMVMFSELACFGPLLQHAQPLPGAAEEQLQEMAKKHRIWLVNGSMYERRDGAIYNTTSVIDPEGEVVGRTQLEMLSRSARTFAHARRAYDPAQFFDVEYDDFVADPVAMTRSIYEAFALEWSEDVEAAVRDIDAESRQGAKKPSHRYQLADYGLTEEEVGGLFEGL